MSALVKKYLIETGVKFNAIECLELIVPFAKTLNHVENNLRVCLKNDVKNGSQNRNLIVKVAERTLDILNEIKDNALHCRDNHQEYFAVIKCANNVSSLNQIYN